MKKFSFFRQLLPLLLGTLAAHAQGVGTSTTAPDAPVALGIVSGSKEVLPRTTGTSGVNSPAGYHNANPLAAPAWQQLVTTGNTTYIENGTAPQAGANYNISGNGTMGGTLTAASAVVSGAITGSGDSISVVGVGIRANGGLNLGQNTPGNNVLLGYQAGRKLTYVGNGAFNQFVGYQSGYSNTSGMYNLFSGYQSGFNNTSGSYNVFSGKSSGFSNTSGANNAFSGYQSGGGNTTGSNNTLSGYNSGIMNEAGGNNTFSGFESGYMNTSSNNTFSGYRSGYYNQGGSYNTVVGFNSGPTSSSGSLTNATALGANVSLTQNNTVILGNNASVGIGTASPIALLHVNGGVTATPTGSNITYFTAGSKVTQTPGTGPRATVAYFTGGQLWVNNAIVAGALQVTSDRRIKHVLGVSNAAADLALLNRLRITDYTYIDQLANTNQVVKKVLAQEVEEVLPAAVSRSTQALPDVYERATGVRFADGYVTVTTAKAHGLPVTGGRMRFYTPTNAQLDPPVQVVDAHTVRFASAEAHAGGLFVYGKYVDDFCSVDYDALTTLNVSATQALARRVEMLEQQNAALQAGSTADHASLLSLQAQVARLLGEGAQARK